MGAQQLPTRQFGRGRRLAFYVSLALYAGWLLIAYGMAFTPRYLCDAARHYSRDNLCFIEDSAAISAIGWLALGLLPLRTAGGMASSEAHLRHHSAGMTEKHHFTLPGSGAVTSL